MTASPWPIAAGAAVIDLEFVQFHPTALMVAGQPRFLLSEALRGEGARLVNADGEAFMTRYDPAGDLAPRDRVSRAIVRESRRTGKPVYLSLEGLDPDFRPCAISADFRRVPARRPRSRSRSDSCRPRGALRHGWSADRSRRPNHHPGAVCRRRGRVHRRPRRKSSGQQLSAGRARLRRTSGLRDARRTTGPFARRREFLRLPPVRWRD